MGIIYLLVQIGGNAERQKTKVNAGAARKDILDLKKRINPGLQKLNQLRLHIIVKIGDTQDYEFFADINFRELLKNKSLMHLFHHKDPVGPPEELRSDLLCCSWSRACRPDLVIRMRSIDGLCRAAAHSINRTDEEEVHHVGFQRVL